MKRLLFVFVFISCFCVTGRNFKVSSMGPDNSQTSYEEHNLDMSNREGTIIRYLKLRIMLGDTYSSQYSNSYNQAQNDLAYLHYPFTSQWGIGFTKSYTYISPLIIDSCSYANGAVCYHLPNNGSCSNSTATVYHHKNGVKNLNQIISAISTSGYDLFVTLVCGPFCTQSSHSVPITGVTNAVGGRFALLDQFPYWYYTYPSIVKVRIAQHEISHMFGCYDGVCSSNTPCIMNGGFDEIAPNVFNDPNNTSWSNIWCPSCANYFNPSAH